MKKIKTFTQIMIPAFFLTLLPFGAVHADTVIRTGETVSVADDAGVVGDFYTAASIINISGKVEGDFSAAGGRVTLNGEVSEDVLIFGGSVDVHGSIGDDLRVIGGEVVIAEPVTGDVFVIGGTVSILSTASVGGDVVVYGGDVEIAGPVGGDVVGQSSTLRIDAPVAGKVDVTVGELVLGDRAVIDGSVSYVSSKLITRSQNASVEGDVVRNDPVVETPTSDFKSILAPVLVLLFTVLVWFLIARSILQKTLFSAVSRRPRPVLVGLATLLLAPFAIVILLVSVLGTLVGIIALFLYVALILLAMVATIPVIGHIVLKSFNQPATELSLYTIGAGIVTTFLILLVPVIGIVVLFGAFVITIGALVEVLLYPNTVA